MGIVVPQEANVSGSSKPIEILMDGDAFSMDNLVDSIGKTENIHVVKRDFLFRNGNWRGTHFQNYFFASKKASTRVLVMGYSDFHLRSFQARLQRLNGTTAIFSANADPCQGLVRSLPIGLPNSKDTQVQTKFLGDEKLLLKAYISDQTERVLMHQFMRASRSIHTYEPEHL